MSQFTTTRTADQTKIADVERLVRQFETDWRASPRKHPDLATYLPTEPAGRSDALLALTRAELALRWEQRDRINVEVFRERYPELRGEMLSSLVYEEFCLREEAGDGPKATEYFERFPEVADLLNSIFEIHGLFGSNTMSVTPSRLRINAESVFPEAGQTISGFRLVEELGRGAFARVFRAEERRLANRPVALKVARTGSREPQTLARLQHTHIVPIHSFRTDPVTGMHLLCMPYLGRVTLAQVLADSALKTAKTGADLLASIDRIDPSESARPARAVARRTLAGLSYARAIAWWGARLAEALQHAHDRGVWHGDIKPSNVLISDDGLPMLLDFNLAHESRLDGGDLPPTALGGTIAYMAPEQLDALGEGRAEHAEGRADLFSLGVVLFEALAPGHHPFPGPEGAWTLRGALRAVAEERRAGAYWVRDVRPETPVALAVIVDRCLAPKPEDRYSSATELAADLQAVADDEPLVHATEPLPSRSIRWARRHGRGMAMLAPLAVALVISVVLYTQKQVAHGRLKEEIRVWVEKGLASFADDHLDRALTEYDTAKDLAEGDPELRDLLKRALDLRQAANDTKARRDRVDDLMSNSDRLRFLLLRQDGDPRPALREVEMTLKPFSVPSDPYWREHGGLNLLDGRRRDLLVSEVNELLFLWVVKLDRAKPDDPETAERALALCSTALDFARPRDPWLALRARYAGPAPRESSRRHEPSSPDGEDSARACFQWGLLNILEHRFPGAIAWLERAARLKPDDYWAQFHLGYVYDISGQSQSALEHYHVAISLRPAAPWAFFNRGRLLLQRGSLKEAREDLQQAIKLARGFQYVEALLELGNVDLLLGDHQGSRAAFKAAVNARVEPYARAARITLAKLDADAGQISEARAEFDRVVTENPSDVRARLARAWFELRHGRSGRAEADLTVLIRDRPDAEVYAHRALARLDQGKVAGAEADAGMAWHRRPTPSHERLWHRTLLALGRDRDLSGLIDPEDVDLMPRSGARLRSDIRRMITVLEERAQGRAVEAVLAHRTRAVLLSALRDPRAEAEATMTVGLAPYSTEALQVRARVRRRAGDLRGARADVDRALELEPDDVRSLVLRGQLTVELGQSSDGLRDLNRANLRGAPGPIHAARATAFWKLGRTDSALDEWNQALAFDPHDPRLFLGRARIWIQTRQWERACADLDQAADWAGDHAGLLARTALIYATCLPNRPERADKVRAVALQAAKAGLANLPQVAD